MAFTLYTHGVQHEENKINYKVNTLSLFFVLYYLFNFLIFGKLCFVQKKIIRVIKGEISIRRLGAMKK